MTEDGITDSIDVSLSELRELVMDREASVQFSLLVVSDSSRPHELQHTRPPCPLPTPRVYSDSCPLSQGGLACCNSWGRKQLDTTERLK